MQPDLERIFAELAIRVSRHEHEAVFTYDAASALDMRIAGTPTKNLFLKDRKGRRHFLVVLRDDRRLDLKWLASELDADGLSFGSAERLARHLCSIPGAVSLLDILSDEEHTVELVIDAAVWAATAVQCHPYTNTATLVIALADIRRILDAAERVPTILTLPD